MLMAWNGDQILPAHWFKWIAASCYQLTWHQDRFVHILFMLLYVQSVDPAFEPYAPCFNLDFTDGTQVIIVAIFNHYHSTECPSTASMSLLSLWLQWPTADAASRTSASNLISCVASWCVLIVQVLSVVSLFARACTYVVSSSSYPHATEYLLAQAIYISRLQARHARHICRQSKLWIC
jgi:hypothetical protein